MTTSPYYESPRSLTKWIKPLSFKECQDKYSDYAVLERRNGIVLCRMHTAGGPAKYSLQWHNAMPMLFRDIGSDPSNEVFMLSGTDDYWMEGRDSASVDDFKFTENAFDHMFHDGTMLLESYINNIDIPTIAIFNGPGGHCEFGMLSDIVIASEKASFNDGHFRRNFVPGDGMTYVFIERMGFARGARMAYTGEAIDAKTALEWGLVSEVCPHDKVFDRAWELAEFIMTKPRTVRRLTHMVLARHWKRVLHEHLGYGLAHELLSIALEWESENGPMGYHGRPLPQTAPNQVRSTIR